MKNKYITALVLVCMVTFTGCPNPYPAYPTTAPAVTEEEPPEIPTFTSGGYSLTMPPISFLAMMYSEEDDYLAFNDALYITNYMQSWYYNTSDHYEFTLKHITQEEDKNNYILGSYEDERRGTDLSFEEYQLMTGYPCPDMDKDCDGIHFRLKYNGIGKPPHDSKVLEYACELVRRERLVPKNKYVCVDIGYSVRDDIIYADVYIIDGMGKRCIAKEGIVGGNADITYDRTAHSLYFMPHIPEYRKGDIRPMNEPDPADFDVILPYIYTSSDSKRYDLKKLAEEMPDIHTMYIPKYAELDISYLSLFPLDTLYIYVGGMTAEELTALSRLHLDRLVMYGADSKLDMFTECDIHHIGVYMDKPCRDVTGSALYIPSLDEAGIIAEKESEIHDLKTDKIKKLSILSQDSADLSFLSGCTSLEELEISGICDYDGLDAIASLPIKSLAINCPGQDISFISGMDTLERLYIRNGYADVSDSPSLRELYISSANAIVLDGIDKCGQLDSLTLINLGDERRSDLSPLASMHLSKLRLDTDSDMSKLAGCDVKDMSIKGDARSIRSLADITSLERLCIEKATRSDIEYLRQSLPDCDITVDKAIGAITDESVGYTPIEYTVAPGTDDEVIRTDKFVFSRDPECPDDDTEYIFTNISDSDMKDVPQILEEAGVLDGYTSIMAGYPQGFLVSYDIADGKLLPDTLETFLPALITEKVLKEGAESTVVHPGETVCVTLFR